MARSRRLTRIQPSWRRLGWPLLAAVGLAVVDQVVKLAVLAAPPDFPVVPGLLAVRFGTNTGVAFGLLQRFPLAVTFVGGGILVALLAYLGRITPVATTLERAALSLIIGGAMGNLADRLRLGYVVDYLDLSIGRYHWPTFNLADSAITIGASMLALGLIRGQRAQAPRRAGSPRCSPRSYGSARPGPTIGCRFRRSLCPP